MADERIPDPGRYESPPRQSLDRDAIQIEDTPIGRGGQAVVYEATVTGDTPPRRVAVKQPLQPSTVTDAVVDAFLSEAATWETVDTREREKLRWEGSEYVVGVVDTGDQLPWIAMEYMDGGSLAERLGDEPDGLPIAEALWIGESICRGLEVAHSYGIAHLDLKPANVLLRATEADSWDHPKVADWGLARVLAERTGSMDARSPRYSAPEQFEPESFGDPDTLTDVYQVGGLVYAMLTGNPPYQGPQFSVISDIISTEPPAPPSTHRPAISSALDDVLTRALSPSKRDRYDSIQSLRKALTAQRTGESIGVRSVAAPATGSANDGDTTRKDSDSSTRPWPTFQSDPERTGYRATVTGPQNPVEPA
jgi:serine/threonine protein kinase